jgi:hypothetical protein
LSAEGDTVVALGTCSWNRKEHHVPEFEATYYRQMTAAPEAVTQ